jgi:hypothetical protein
MCEIIVKAIDVTHPDPEKDRRGCYKRGYPVAVYPDGTKWGNEERLPKFVIIKIPDATVEEVQHFIQSWQRQIDWAVVGQSLPLDGFRLRVFATNLSVTDQGVGAGKITRAMVETYLTNWGASVFSVADNEVVFDVRIYNAAISQGFWDTDLTGIIFSEISYVQATGVHTIQVNYTAKIAWKAKDVEMRITMKGGTIISNNSGIARFTITRAAVSDAFKMDVKQKVKQTLYRRQYYFPSALMDSIISMGGVQTTNKATVLSVIHNRLTE